MKRKILIFLVICASLGYTLHGAARGISEEFRFAPARQEDGSQADALAIKHIFTSAGLPGVIVMTPSDAGSNTNYPPRYTVNGGSVWYTLSFYDLNYRLLGIAPRNDPQVPVRLFSDYGRSGDWGKTWENTSGHPLGFSPKNPLLVYGVSGYWRGIPVDEFVSVIYQSTDGGVTWTTLLEKTWATISKITPSPVTATDGYYYQAASQRVGDNVWRRFGSDEELAFPVATIALDAVNAERIYGVTEDFSAGHTSSDGGHNWVAWSSIPSGACSQLLAHPTQTNTLYLRCDSGIYRSVDGGDSWSQITNIPGDALEPNLGTPGQLLWSHSSCLWASDDQGTTWARLNCFSLTSSNVFLPLVR